MTMLGRLKNLIIGNQTGIMTPEEQDIIVLSRDFPLKKPISHKYPITTLIQTVAIIEDASIVVNIIIEGQTVVLTTVLDAITVIGMDTKVACVTWKITRL